MYTIYIYIYMYMYIQMYVYIYKYTCDMCNCSSKQKQTPLKTAQHSAHNVFSSAITLPITCETSSTATCTTSG